MGITAGEVYQLAARFGAKAVEEQSQMVAKFFDQKLDILDQPGQTGYVNVKTGGVDSTGFIADAATLPGGASVEVQQLYYTPKFLFSRLSLPRGGLELANGVKDGVRLLVEQLKSAAADVARQRGRAVFSKSLGSPYELVDVSTNTKVFKVVDVTGLKPGMSVDVYNGATFIETVVIASISWATTGPLNGLIYYEVNTVDDIGSSQSPTPKATDWQTSFTLFVQGSKTNGMFSLADVCANADLYQAVSGSNEWTGNLDASTTSLSEGALRTMHDQIRNRRGVEVDCIVMNPLNVTRYLNLSTDQRRFAPGDALDKYGRLTPTFDGIEVFADVNCGDKDIFFFNSDDVKLHRFRKFGPDTDGMRSPALGASAAIVSSTSFTYDIQMYEAMELRVTRRNGTGHMSAIAS